MAAAMVDGVYQDIAEALKPGVKESEIVALATGRLYEMGSDCVEAINSISGERCSPHPHNFTDRLIRPGDQAFFDIIQSFMGYRTCYYRTFNVGLRDGRAARRVPQGARVDGRRDRPAEARRVDATRSRAALPKAEDIGFASEMEAFGLNFCHGLGLGLHERPLVSRLEFAQGADRAQGRDGVRGRDVLPGERRHLGRADRGGGDPDADGAEDHLALSGGRAADRESLLIDRRTMMPLNGNPVDARPPVRGGAQRRRSSMRSMALYEPQAALMPSPGKVVVGAAAIREALGRSSSPRSRRITTSGRLVAQTGDIALLANRAGRSR